MQTLFFVNRKTENLSSIKSFLRIKVTRHDSLKKVRLHKSMIKWSNIFFKMACKKKPVRVASLFSFYSFYHQSREVIDLLGHSAHVVFYCLWKRWVWTVWGKQDPSKNARLLLCNATTTAAIYRHQSCTQVLYTASARGPSSSMTAVVWVCTNLTRKIISRSHTSLFNGINC